MTNLFTPQQLMDLRRQMLALVDAIERTLKEQGAFTGPTTSQIRKERKCCSAAESNELT